MFIHQHSDSGVRETILEQRIEGTEREIRMQEATIASLSIGGHEVTDATRHLNRLLETHAALVRARMKAG